MMKASKGVAVSGRKSYVYLIRCIISKSAYYKIGIAYNLLPRLSSLQCGNPIRLDLMCAVLVDDARALERDLHQQYIESNEMREWFFLSNIDSHAIIEAMHNQGGVLYATPSNL